MTIKEKSILLKTAFPDAGFRKISQIVGCDRNTVKFHLSPEFNANQLKRNEACRKEKVAKRKFILVQFLGGQCSECGYRDCYAALEFHHKDPSKKIEQVADLLSGSFNKALEEAKKCILLCGNCHQALHEKENDLSEIHTRFSDNTGVGVAGAVNDQP